jgi:hypothetical protein
MERAMLKYEPEIHFNPADMKYVVMGPSAQKVAADVLIAFNKDVEGKIRQALIDLGWTPPPVTKSASSE